MLSSRQRIAAVKNAIARIRPPTRVGPFVGRLKFHPPKMEPDVGCYNESSREVLKILKERELAFSLLWDKDSRGIFQKWPRGEV